MPALTTEQVTIIRAGLDASAYQAGANVIVEANKRIDASGGAVVQTQAAAARSMTDSGGAFDRYRQRVDQSYASIQQFSRIQEAANTALRLGRTTVDDANATLVTYAAKFGLVSAAAQEAARRTAEAAQAAQAMVAAQTSINRATGVQAPSSTEDYAKRQADVTAYGAALDALKARYNPLFAASQQYQSSLAAIDAAEKTGAISTTEAAAARDQATTAYTAAISANQAYAASIDPIVQQQNRATAAQAQYNQLLGVKAPASQQDYAARAADIQAYGAALDQARAKYDPLFAASKQYEATLDEIDQFERAGALSTAQATAARDSATKSFADGTGTARALGLAVDDAGKKAGSAAAGMVTLGHGSAGVTREFIVMAHEIVTGQFNRIPGSFLVLSERVDLLRNGIQSLALAAISPTGLAVLGGVAVTGALVAFAYAAESSALRIERLRDQLSLVRADYIATAAQADSAARHLAATSYLSTADSRSGINAVFANPGFQGTSDQAEKITRIFADLSAALGEQTTDWKRLSEALSNPAALMQTLLDQNHLTGLNQQLVNQIKALQDAGDKAAATGLALDALARATKHVVDNKTGLEQALRALSQLFTEGGQNGRTFSEVIGAHITKSAEGAVWALALLTLELQKLRANWRLPDGILTPEKIREGIDAARGGVSGAGSATGLRGNIPAYAATSIDEMAGHLGLSKALDDFATRIAQIESGGNQFDRNGSIRTSSAGALGFMQVMPDSAFGDHTGSTTARTVGGTAYDLTQETSNIEAGLRILSELYRQFDGDLSKVAVGYNAGPKALTYNTLPKETLDYLAKLGLPEPPHGNNPGGSVPALAAAAAPPIPIPPVPPAAPLGVTGPTPEAGVSGATLPSNYGMVNRPEDVLQKALEAAKALGASGFAAEAAQIKIDAFNKALSQTGNSAKTVGELNEALGKAQLELYNAVPAAQNLLRTIDLQTTGEVRLTAAWGQGASAAAAMTSRIRAETEARQFASPQTAQYSQLVEVLTQKYNALARATQGAQGAQASSVNQDNLRYIQAETASLTMNDEARTLMLAHLRAEMDLKRQYSQNPEMVAKLLAENDAIQKQSYALNQQKSALAEVSNSFQQSFDTIGNAITQSLLQGQGAAVNWRNVMLSIAQQVLQEFLKLSVLNPLLNALFGGNRATLSGLFGSPGASGGAGVGGLTQGVGALGALGTFGQGLGNLASGFAWDGMAAGSQLADLTAQAASNASQIGFGAFGALIHTGGLVGTDALPRRQVDASVFLGAPRYHGGLNSDEFAAILQRGERVLTANQNDRMAATLRGLTAKGEKSSAPAPTIVFNITTPNADSFQRSQAQIMARAGAMISGAQRRNG